MNVNRRDFLSVGAGSFAAISTFGDPQRPPASCGMGMVAYSFSIRRAAEPRGRLQDPLGCVEHCRELGAGGLQIDLGTRDREYCARLRDRVRTTGMYLEGIGRLPRDRDDIERFEGEVRTLRDCGADVLRVALMNGRRYETFRTAQEFRDFRERGRTMLTLARPIAERHRVRIAVENHKDLRAAEQAELMRWARSPQIGVCVDTGNNLALLETPEETAETLAPFAFTTHLKDMGVAEYPEGFLLAEVPLGTGFLDLPRILRILRRANPTIRFNLEMITRDPLRIPCLTPRYWATLEDVPGRRLAEILTLVRARAPRQGLPRVSDLDPPRRLEREDENVRRCLQYARETLRL
jgi:3-oxoisoapionate decarboxylase